MREEVALDFETGFYKRFLGMISTHIIAKKIVFLEIVDSTNNYAKTLPDSAFTEKTVIIADSQTAGRGRLGRGWVSHPGKGLYMSLLAGEPLDWYGASQFMILSACGIRDALSGLTRLDVKIKWPNDIYIGMKKICGILTELTGTANGLSRFIIGIGININQTAFDLGGLDRPATSLLAETGVPFDRAVVAAAVLNQLDKNYAHYLSGRDMGLFLEKYRKDCITIGKLVRLQNGTEGLAEDIGENGTLLVRTNGRLLEVNSGEVTVSI